MKIEFTADGKWLLTDMFGDVYELRELAVPRDPIRIIPVSRA